MIEETRELSDVLMEEKVVKSQQFLEVTLWSSRQTISQRIDYPSCPRCSQSHYFAIDVISYCQPINVTRHCNRLHPTHVTKFVLIHRQHISQNFFNVTKDLEADAIGGANEMSMLIFSRHTKHCRFKIDRFINFMLHFMVTFKIFFVSLAPTVDLISRRWWYSKIFIANRKN